MPIDFRRIPEARESQVLNPNLVHSIREPFGDDITRFIRDKNLAELIGLNPGLSPLLRW